MFDFWWDSHRFNFESDIHYVFCDIFAIRSFKFQFFFMELEIVKHSRLKVDIVHVILLFN